MFSYLFFKTEFLPATSSALQTSLWGFLPTSSPPKPEMELLCKMRVARFQAQLPDFIHWRPTFHNPLVRSGLRVSKGKLDSTENVGMLRRVA